VTVKHCIRITSFLCIALVGNTYGGNTSGQITEIYINSVDYPNLVFVQVNGTNTQPPVCSNIGNWYVFDGSSNSGKQIYAVLLAAKHAGANVRLIGQDVCTFHPNIENLKGVAQN
jgi:hypothetical protein